MKRFLKGVDAFGQPVALSYKGDTSYRTSFGGFLTLVLITLLILMSLSSIQTLLFREHIYTSSSTLDNLDPLELAIPFDNGFYFALGFSPDQLNNSTNPAFLLSIEQRKFKRYSNGTRAEVRRLKIPLEPCEAKHFPNNFDYVKNGLAKWVCAPRNTTMTIKGLYETEEFEYVRIAVDRCKNSTQSNITCMDPVEIKRIINTARSDGNFFIKMVLSSHLFNLQNFNEPVLHYIETSNYFLIDTVSSFKTVDMFLKHNTVITDYNMLLPSKETKIYPSFLNYREQTSTLSTDTLATIFLRCALQRGLYEGSSEKFTSVLASFGGLSSSIYAIMLIFAKFFNRKRLLISLSNFLYNFEVMGGKKPTIVRQLEEVPFEAGSGAKSDIYKLKESKEPHSKLTLDGPASCTDRPISSKSPDYVELVKKENVDSDNFLKKIQAYLSRFTKLRSSWISVLFSFLLAKREGGTSKMEKLYQKAFKRVEKDLDIMNILNRVREVERLKSFLFDENQKILFEFFPKEVVKLKPKTKKRKKSKKEIKMKRTVNNRNLRKVVSHGDTFYIDRGPVSLYMELFRAYHKAIQTENLSEKENAKLISLLGNHIITIIKNEDWDINS